MFFLYKIMRRIVENKKYNYKYDIITLEGEHEGFKFDAGFNR